MNNMKKQIEITLERAKELYAQKMETMNELILEHFTKEELEGKKDIKRWEDLENFGGYFVTVESTVGSRHFFKKGLLRNKNTWATKEQAEASIAMAQLSQLMKHVNGDWVADWEGIYTAKFSILNTGKIDCTGASYERTAYLTFQTPEIRDSFMENNKELIEIAKPLL